MQKPEEHECRINSDLFVHLILVSILLALLIFNILKYRFKRKKRLMRKLMEIAKSRIFPEKPKQDKKADEESKEGKESTDEKK